MDGVLAKIVQGSVSRPGAKVVVIAADVEPKVGAVEAVLGENGAVGDPVGFLRRDCVIGIGDAIGQIARGEDEGGGDDGKG